MPLPEIGYSEFREKAERFNAQAAKYSFCKGINGGCCIPNVNMLEDDKKLIIDAASRGKIEKSVIRRARRRAKDPEVNSCPFLGDDEKCTIYPYRPIKCIQHGNGGIPRSEEDVKAIASGAKESLTAKELVPFSCKDCLAEVDSETQIPREVIMKTMFIKDSNDNNPTAQSTPMNVFLLRDLPKWTY